MTHAPRNLVLAAKAYYALGFNALPLSSPVTGQSKHPNIPWRAKDATKGIEGFIYQDYTVERFTPADIEMHSNRYQHGIVGITGISHYRVIDIDHIKDWSIVGEVLELLELPADYPWVVISGSGAGVQIWFHCVESMKKSWYDYTAQDPDRFDHVELRWSGSCCVLPPSAHPSGGHYRFRTGGRIPSSTPVTVTISVVLKALTTIGVVRDTQERVRSDAPGQDNSLYEKVKACLAVIADHDDDAEVACPWAAEHTDGRVNAHIWRNNGHPGFSCLHAHCKDRGWRDVLAFLHLEESKPGGFHRTDLGNAERFDHLYGDRVRWCEIWKSWMVFNGKYWEQDRTGQVDRLAKATVRSIYAEAANESDDAERKKLVKHALASESSRAVRALLDRAKSELPVSPHEFNCSIHLLNCANGTLDLRTGELRPHNPADMLTRCLKTAYNREATYPRWEQFLQFIFNEDWSLIAFLQEALGMSLSGDVSEECLFICHGSGSNGKTTLLETIRIILEAYGLAANIETFQVRKGERINNDVAELYGARFVTASENTIGSRLNEAFMKKATGNEPLRARRLHENEFQFMPEFTLWLAVNHKPIVKDTTRGMWRRVHFIPFTVTIEGRQVDKRLGEKLLEEAEGILAWLVEGCVAWYKDGYLSPPTIVQDATQAYREEMDVIANFLSERCEFKEDARIGATPLYSAYKTWCETTGERWEKQTGFGNRLAERGLQKEKTRTGIVYRGIGLTAIEE